MRKNDKVRAIVRYFFPFANYDKIATKWWFGVNVQLLYGATVARVNSRLSAVFSCFFFSKFCANFLYFFFTKKIHYGHLIDAKNEIMIFNKCISKLSTKSTSIRDGECAEMETKKYLGFKLQSQAEFVSTLLEIFSINQRRQI